MNFCMPSASVRVRHYWTQRRRPLARNISSKCHNPSARMTSSPAQHCTCWWSSAMSKTPNVFSPRWRVQTCRSVEWWWMVTISTMNHTNVCNSSIASKTRISLWMKWYLSQRCVRVPTLVFSQSLAGWSIIFQLSHWRVAIYRTPWLTCGWVGLIGILSSCTMISPSFSLARAKWVPSMKPKDCFDRFLTLMWSAIIRWVRIEQSFVCCSLCLFLPFLVNAYARNGMGSDAIAVYQEMPEHIRDQVSHICVLNACSHAGLIDQARSIFSSIRMKTGNIVGTMVRSFHRWTISIIINLGWLSFSYVDVWWRAATDRRLWNISPTLSSDVQWVSHRSEWMHQ